MEKTQISYTGVQSAAHAKDIEKNALNGCPGIEKEGHITFRGERPWVERASVIHGSPIEKP